ncbi:MAG: peroxide stress protein YaaA [Parvularculaceae bacterium]|nr:peroxide stress protein YaaA [Parvularculaceae bacterium]
MIILLSPAKNLNFDAEQNAPRATKPARLADARMLADCARTLSVAQLQKLMSISERLAVLNYERFAAFRGDGKSNSQKHAALAFNGDVYLGLKATTFNEDEFAFAQAHLRILSGLYGILRPLDAIEAYRLEMGSALKNPAGKNLYAFWRDRLAGDLNKAVKASDGGEIVNLASKEYYSAIDEAALNFPVITPNFKEEKDGSLRQIQFYAKRARGLMARWAIENRIERAEDLKDFSVDGYKFQKSASSPHAYLFTRPQPPARTKMANTSAKAA